MLPEMELVIFNNNKVMQTIKKEVNGKSLAKAIEDFQITANAAMSKLIEQAGGGGDCVMDEDDAEDSDNEEDNTSVSPKRIKK